MHEQFKGLSERALEMVMRDVLDGLEDLALSAALDSGGDGGLILSIGRVRPTGRSANKKTPAGPAEVVDLDSYRRSAVD